jgi:hypothetical protein
MNFRTLIYSFVLIVNISCKENKTPTTKGTWHYTKSFPLTNVNPISITGDDSHLYVSSGLKTEIFKLNYDGGLVQQIKNIRKPKYLNLLSTGVVVVAESEAHVASRVEGQDYITTIPTNDFLETPYGISIESNRIAISDLAKGKVYYNNGGKVNSITENLSSPTDVQFKNGKLYIADIKSNLIQVFDTLGKPRATIGKSENLKMIGGLYVNNEEIAVTDYNGNRLLVYDLKGKLKQSFTEQLQQPSDVFIKGREMFVVNYGSNEIAVYSKW